MCLYQNLIAFVSSRTTTIQNKKMNYKRIKFILCQTITCYECIFHIVYHSVKNVNKSSNQFGQSRSQPFLVCNPSCELIWQTLKYLSLMLNLLKQI